MHMLYCYGSYSFLNLLRTRPLLVCVCVCVSSVESLFREGGALLSYRTGYRLQWTRGHWSARRWIYGQNKDGPNAHAMRICGSARAEPQNSVRVPVVSTLKVHPRRADVIAVIHRMWPTVGGPCSDGYEQRQRRPQDAAGTAQRIRVAATYEGPPLPFCSR
jgi:hypothetical protein